MEGKLFKRKLEDEIRKFVKRREIIGIRGARQTGKTTLLKVIERSTVENRAFINLDLLLDEIQKIKDVGEKLKIIFDEFPDVVLKIS